MKRWGMLAVCVALFVSGARGAELSSNSRIRENIAVVDFEGKGVSSLDASIFADFLRTGLVNTGTFNVVEKANMEKLLREMAFQQTGLTSTEDAVRMGKILNVRKMVAGSVSRLADTFYITASLVDVESAKIDKSETLSCRGTGEFAEAASDLAERFSGAVIVERTALRRKVWIVMSPKAGYFSLMDPVAAKHHPGKLSYGADVSLWMQNNGVSLDYEQYDDEKDIPSGETLLRNYRGYTWTSGQSTVREKLYLKSLTLNYLRKFSDSQTSYLYAGAGFGKSWSKIEGDPIGSADFLTYDLKLGFKHRGLGLVLKYAYTPANAEWMDVNFQGFSIFLSYNFVTAVNLY